MRLAVWLATVQELDSERSELPLSTLPFSDLPTPTQDLGQGGEQNTGKSPTNCSPSNSVNL